MESYQNAIVDEMVKRERGKQIHQNNEIYSKVGILGIPNGVGRKKIIIDLIQRDAMKWSNGPFIFSSYENIYNQGIIFRKNNFQCSKRKVNLIVCHRYLLPSWVDHLKEHNVSYHLYKNHSRIENWDSISVILLRHSLLQTFLERHFCRIAVQRIILYNPQYFLLKKFTFLLYGFAWIVLDNPKWILSSVQKHFCHNFVPVNIDYYIFRQLNITRPFNDAERPILHQKSLYKCQKEIFLILKDSISSELYDLLERGKIEEVLAAFGSQLHCRNIYKHILDDYQNKLDAIELKIMRYEELGLTQKILNFQEKRHSLVERMTSFKRRIMNFTLDNACVICNGQMKDVVLLHCCQNVLCGNCILKLVHLGQACPYCRKKLLNDSITMLDETIFSENPNPVVAPTMNPPLLSRQEQLLRILDSIGDESCLLYVPNRESIEMFMEDKGCTNYRIFQGRYLEKKLMIESLKQSQFQYLFVMDHLELLGFKFPHLHNFISFIPLKMELENFFLHKFYGEHRESIIHIHLFHF